MNRRLLPLAAASLAAGLCVLSACRSDGGKAGERPAVRQEGRGLPGRWVLTHVEREDATDLLPPGGRLPEITIASDGALSGFGGINRIASRVDMSAAAEGRFKVDPVMATKMGGHPAAMRTETRFLDLLSRANAYRFEGDRLILTRAGMEALIFKRGDQ